MTLFQAILFAGLLGLAPFTPEPHIWEKLKMLVAGTLVRPIDWFDLLLHGTPWVILAIKLGQWVKTGQTGKTGGGAA
ncbi:MAG: RND transporter [Rhodobacteraceae bacterium]|nr:MAG: RND transporter [Paracoccaceae bacterium]TNF16679.1 MAG: RND transporter [Paracoccaceae bacterium]